MVPKFANLENWQRAEVLMQPVFIRMIDNIRKELEQSSWQGTYRDSPVWAEDVSPETKSTVAALQATLNTASPEEAERIRDELAHLPQPHPGYQLCLQQGDHEVIVDLWELCYQICFRNYHPVINTLSHPIVEVDTSLLDEMGEVDWTRLDQKAHALIAQIFASLP